MTEDQALGQRRLIAEHAEAILEAMVEGVIVIDQSGVVRTFNGAAERIFAYPAGEVIGLNISMLMPQPYAAEHDGYLARYQLTREERIIGLGREIEGRRRDGSVFPLNLSVGAIHHEGEAYFVGVIRDLSIRRRLEASVANSEAQLRLIFDQAPVGSFTVDREGRVRSCNAAFEVLLGRDATAILGVQHADLVHPQDRAEVEFCINRLLTANADEPRCVHEVRYQLSKPDELAYTHLHAGLVRLLNGEPLIVCQVVDLSDRVRAEGELRLLRDRLAHVNRISVMGEMASGIAHEMNQPLTAIAAYAQACRRLHARGETGDVDFAEALDQIAAQAQRAGEVIRRLRGFVRREDSHKSAVSVQDLLGSVVKLAEVDTRSHDVQIESVIEPSLPPVLADAIQIQQVVLNLLRNAMEASSEANSGRRPRVDLLAFAAGNQVCVEVLDRGKGIDPDAVHSLFTPFFTTKATGLGLGLSICQSIISDHGGRIEYRFREGGGSVFHFCLPVVIGSALSPSTADSGVGA